MQIARFLSNHWRIVLSIALVGGAGIAVAYSEATGGSLGISDRLGGDSSSHAALASFAALVIVLVTRSRRSAAKKGPRP